MIDAPEPDKALPVRWIGDHDVLPYGEPVTILATDLEDPAVPARRACWVRYWPEGERFPQYRSCDLSDLDMPEEEESGGYAPVQPISDDSASRLGKLRHALCERDHGFIAVDLVISTDRTGAVTGLYGDFAPGDTITLGLPSFLPNEAIAHGEMRKGHEGE